MKYLIYIVAFLFLPLTSLQADVDNEERILYERAINEYQNNNFEEAHELFEKLIAGGYSSYKLYYNAGNAAFKTGKIASAVLNYEKALRLKPFREDARYNLEIARSYTLDKLEVIPEVFFARWFKIFSLLLHTNTWAFISLGCFALSLVLLSVFLFSASYRLKKITFYGAVLVFTFSLLSFALALTNKSLTVNNREAIVFDPVLTGSSSPGTGGSELFVIHEGTKVEIEDRLGEWYEIRLSDGTVGWVPVNSIKKIIP
ncbi:MAG: SH3 domain-containing protein [Bacteroidales bacterium]|nr:SH3 domain-containing protein [Bacteroidales bacterium]